MSRSNNTLPYGEIFTHSLALLDRNITMKINSFHIHPPHLHSYFDLPTNLRKKFKSLSPNKIQEVIYPTAPVPSYNRSTLKSRDAKQLIQDASITSTPYSEIHTCLCLSFIQLICFFRYSSSLSSNIPSMQGDEVGTWTSKTLCPLAPSSVAW